MKKLDFADVLIEPGVCDKPLTRAEVNITPNGYVPIIIANMVTTGRFDIAEIAEKHEVLTFLSKEYTADEMIKNLLKVDPDFVGLTSGVKDFDHKRILKVLEVHNDFAYLNVDIANVGANVQGMVDTIRLYRDKYPGKIVAGNVATVEMAVLLEKAGADIIKVGIGSGAACTTRTEVGVGVPQLSAIQDIVSEVSVPVISDGGCTTPGDVCKAIAAGASYVMLGGMFASCKEMAKPGHDHVDFFGLGSEKMYTTYVPTESEYRPVEGRTLQVPIKTTMPQVINQIKGALRSVCTYVGVDSIDDLNASATFIEVNNQYNRSLEHYG